MNRFDFKSRILWSPEDEGGGGGGEGGDGPTNDVSALSSRLDSMAKTLEGVLSGQKQRDTQAQLGQFERQLNSELTEATNKVAEAEKALAAAFDEGTGVEVAKAQRHLTEMVAEVEGAKGRKAQYEAAKKQQEHRQGGAGQSSVDTTNLNQWKARHKDWYGVDSEMTKVAHEIDGQIRAAGVIPVGSKEYFESVDRQLKSRFPDKIGGSPNMDHGGNGVPNTPRRGRIAQSVADGWRRMGIDMSDPKVVERMIKNRQTAVDKGILSPDPAAGRVRTD